MEETLLNQMILEYSELEEELRIFGTKEEHKAAMAKLTALAEFRYRLNKAQELELNKMYEELS